MPENEMEDEGRVSPATELPFVLQGQPMRITASEGNITNNYIPEDEMPEDLSQSIPASLPPPPTESEMQEAEDDREQADAERAAEQQDRMQEAIEKVADRKKRAYDANALFNVDKEDVMGGTEADFADDVSVDPDDFSVDADDFEISEEDVMGGSSDDFRDILEVSEEDVMGKPPPAQPLRKIKRPRIYNSPANPQLGGMTY